jgi:hypothetical protein
MIGALVPEAGAESYSEALGLAAPSACSPAALPDGRVLFAWAPGGRGDFGLWVSRPNGTELQPVFDEPGRLELDPAPVTVRRVADAGWRRVGGITREGDRALLTGRLDDPALGRFDFECEDVFESGGLPGAPVRASGLSLRFFAALPRFDREPGDTAVLVRTEPIGSGGQIRARGLPAGVPMFEQVVDARGQPLMTSRGPAHVAGMNSGAAGQVTRCVGCHAGHSRLPVSARSTAGR